MGQRHSFLLAPRLLLGITMTDSNDLQDDINVTTKRDAVYTEVYVQHCAKSGFDNGRYSEDSATVDVMLAGFKKQYLDDPSCATIG